MGHLIGQTQAEKHLHGMTFGNAQIGEKFPLQIAHIPIFLQGLTQVNLNKRYLSGKASKGHWCSTGG
ncbi:MAG: hypothetical protein ACI906_004635 [Candidatus Latescibacterota bacterium]|jgi:hypothetical protein